MQEIFQGSEIWPIRSSRTCHDDPAVLFKADSLAQIAERIALDFSLSEEEINDQIEKRIGSFSRRRIN